MSLAATPPAVRAGATPEAIPYEAQVQVNTTTFGDQLLPAVAELPGDGWVVVWADEGATPNVLRSRKFDRAGTPIDIERTLATASSFAAPRIEQLDDGRLIAVWREEEGGLRSVRARFFSSVGWPTGDTLTLRDPTADPLVFAVDIAPAQGGGFVAVWSTSSDVFLRRFDAQGTPVALEQPVNMLGGLGEPNPSLQRLGGAGGHVIVWQSLASTGDDTDSFSIQWRRMNAGGTLLGTQSQANSFTQGAQVHPHAAASSDGGFAILWMSWPNPGLSPEGEPIGDGIDLRFFRPDGTPLGPETTISLDPAPTAKYPVLANGLQGELLASWTADPAAISLRRIGARYPIGPEFAANDAPSSTLLGRPSVAIDGEGDFAVVWHAYGTSPGGDTSGASVQLRTFTIGRVAHWRLEEAAGQIAVDLAGLVGDHAVLAGDGIDWSWGWPGQTALAFAGVGLEGWADISSPSSDLEVSDAALTLTAWLYLETPPSELFEPFASVYDAAQDNYALYLDRDNQELRFKVTDADGTAERPGIPEAVLPLHRWIHVAGVYYGDTGAAQIYLDGELIDTHVNPNLGGPVRSTPAQVAALGRDGVNARYYFDGRIDEVEVWRRALSQDEIRLFRGPRIYGDGFERGSTLGWSIVVP